MNELEKAILGQSLLTPTGVTSPECCGHSMKSDGGCSEGCCDDFLCETCGKRLRVEWPD